MNQGVTSKNFAMSASTMKFTLARLIRQGVERVMRASYRPKAIAEPEEILLVNRVQHRRRGALDDLVLQRRHRQRASSAVRLGDVDPPARRRPIRPALHPVVKVREVAFEVRFVVLPRHPVDPGSRVPPRFEEGRLQKLDADVVQERGELLLLVAPCGLPYALQRL